METERERKNSWLFISRLSTVSFWTDLFELFRSNPGKYKGRLPLCTHPLGPRINQNLRTDRPDVLAKYGLCGLLFNMVMRCFSACFVCIY